LTLPDFLNFHLPSPISQFDFDAASFPAHTWRMAKKLGAEPTAKTPRSFLDTSVIYCRDWQANHYVIVMFGPILSENDFI
jgi:hypothetical protein